MWYARGVARRRATIVIQARPETPGSAEQRPPSVTIHLNEIHANGIDRSARLSRTLRRSVRSPPRDVANSLIPSRPEALRRSPSPPSATTLPARRPLLSPYPGNLL